MTHLYFSLSLSVIHSCLITTQAEINVYYGPAVSLLSQTKKLKRNQTKNSGLVHCIINATILWIMTVEYLLSRPFTHNECEQVQVMSNQVTQMTSPQ